MRRVLLINPNSSRDTTAMMVAIAQACAPDVEVIGATATRSPPMIVTEEALAESAAEVVEMGMREVSGVSGIVVSAFGDPGMEELAARVSIPVVGIAEAAMREAGQDGRRFGIATVTPDLAKAIEDRVRSLGLMPLFTGIRLTAGDPAVLAADAVRLEASLRQATLESFDQDGAEAVIIGGGPLGQAAAALQSALDRPVIAPIPAAMRRLMRMIG